MDQSNAPGTEKRHRPCTFNGHKVWIKCCGYQQTGVHTDHGPRDTTCSRGGRRLSSSALRGARARARACTLRSLCALQWKAGPSESCRRSKCEAMWRSIDAALGGFELDRGQEIQRGSNRLLRTVDGTVIAGLAGWRQGPWRKTTNLRPPCQRKPRAVKGQQELDDPST